jgi:hypothetical protein
MVITMEAERQHEEAEKQAGQQGGPTSTSPSNPTVMNSRVQSGGGSMSGDTIEYINENA